MAVMLEPLVQNSEFVYYTVNKRMQFPRVAARWRLGRPPVGLRPPRMEEHC